MESIDRDLPTGSWPAIAYDATSYISNAIGGAQTSRHADHRHGRHLPLHRLVPLGAVPGVAIPLSLSAASS